MGAPAADDAAILTILSSEPVMAAAPTPLKLEPPSTMVLVLAVNVRFEFEATMPAPAVPPKLLPPRTAARYRQVRVRGDDPGAASAATAGAAPDKPLTPSVTFEFETTMPAPPAPPLILAAAIESAAVEIQRQVRPDDAGAAVAADAFAP